MNLRAKKLLRRSAWPLAIVVGYAFVLGVLIGEVYLLRATIGPWVSTRPLIAMLLGYAMLFTAFALAFIVARGVYWRLRRIRQPK